jgi:hypothetical protein
MSSVIWRSVPPASKLVRKIPIGTAEIPDATLSGSASTVPAAHYVWHLINNGELINNNGIVSDGPNVALESSTGIYRLNDARQFCNPKYENCRLSR